MATIDQEPIKKTAPAEQAGARAARWRAITLSVPVVTWESIAWLALGFTAILTRFWNLGARVTSHDESLHVYFSWILSKGGGYTHNPMMHGPLLFELTALFDRVFGTNDFTSRMVPALIGIFIVIGIPLLLRHWLGRFGSLAASLFFLVSPYILYFSRYNRHDIEIIAWALLAVAAMFTYLRERYAEERVTKPVNTADDLPLLVSSAAEPGFDGMDLAEAAPADTTAFEAADENGQVAAPTREKDDHEEWLLVLAGAVGLMFSTMETSFFYLAIFAGFLILRLLVRSDLTWNRIRSAAEFDLLVVLATLGAFFSAPIALVLLNPIWTRLTGDAFVPVSVFSTYGIEWASGPYGMRIWGLMVFFWVASAVVGIWWGRMKWLRLAAFFLIITLSTFTTFFTNKSGIGTGFIGSLGYWLSQQNVARGSQPWYFYLIVFPIYEYLPILGGIAAAIYYAFRRRSLPVLTSAFVSFLIWWAVLILTGLTAAGEKMPWLSTHITVPFVLLAAWLAGDLLLRWQLGRRAQQAEAPPGVGLSTRTAALGLIPLAVLFVLTARTSYWLNYVNYDSVVEFADYAHGAPGVKWLADDVNAISAKLGQGDALPVAYDSANSWPLAWYLRNHPGFYGEQPNRAGIQNAPIVIAGSQNWTKVENYLGANYNRYDVIRIWWPMEDYKNLTWDRIRGAITDPAMRRAVWDILWARDYTRYAALTGETLNPPQKWPLEDRMRVYIRKDVVAQIPNLRLATGQMADIPVQVDLYASKKITLAPSQVIQPADLKNPRNLAFAPDGSIYVADSGNSRIVHLDAQGKELVTWGSRTPDKQSPPAPGTFNEPWGIAVDQQGNVYVTDTWNHRIQKFDSTGKFLLEWGIGGLSTDGADRFWGPRGIAIGPNGNIYITDTGNRRVVVYDSQGKFQFEFSKDGNAQLNEPVGIAVSKSGSIFVLDTWNNRVALFDEQGKYLNAWPVQAWSSASVDDKPFLALDGTGKVYLSDPEANRVLVFNEQGAPLAVFGQFGQEQESFNLPTGLAIDAKGNLWVADAGNNRLDVYPPVK